MAVEREDHIGADPTEKAAPGITRRTIVAGAAWSVPVVALAVGAPLAAASTTDLALIFAGGPFTVETCAELDPVVLVLSDSNGPVSGATVSVSLPAGLTWEDGTTTPRPFTTDGSGQVTVTGITGTDTSGDFAISATSTVGAETANASATVTVTAPPVGHRAINGTVQSDFPGIPTGSTAVGGGYFLSPAGGLYSNAGLLVSGVVSAWGVIDNTNSYVAEYVTATGPTYGWRIVNDVVSTIYPNVPAGSVSVGGAHYLAPNGDLYFNNVVIASTVVSAVGGVDANGQYFVDFVSNARAWRAIGGVIQQSYDSVPGDVVSVGAVYFRRPNGDLYAGNSLFATNTLNAVGTVDNQGNYAVEFISNGVAFRAVNGAIQTTYTSVPATASPVGATYFLDTNGDLYFGNTIVASNVISAHGEIEVNGFYSVEYVTAVVC